MKKRMRAAVSFALTAAMLASMSVPALADGDEDDVVTLTMCIRNQSKYTGLQEDPVAKYIEEKLGIRINGDSSVQRKYTTSDKYVATIDKNGVVTAVGAGSCKITVVAGNQGGTIDVTVTGGSSASGSAITTGSSTTSSSSTTPDIGNGRPGIDGTATTAPDIGNGRPGLDSNRNAGLESSSGYVPTTSIRIRATRDYVSAGNSIQLEVVFSPSNATGQPVNWSISRGAIYGEVDNRGVFTGIEAGYSTVKVTTADGAYSATYRIEIV